MATTEIANRPPVTAAAFRKDVEMFAANYLARLLGSDEGQRAGARVGLAFTAAVRTAKTPQALMSCSRESVATAVAMSALTGLMPGGPAPAVWLVPKGRELQWWLSHRGITTLCLRAGYQILAVPVHRRDEVRIEFGEVTSHSPNTETSAGSLSDLAGVYLTVRRLDTGIVLCRPWISIQDIEKRQKKALTQDIWRSWPIEMAQKTAIKWAIARGLLPIEGLEMNLALSGEPEEMPAPQPTASGASHAFGFAPSAHIPGDRPLDTVTEEPPIHEDDAAPAESIPVSEEEAPQAVEREAEPQHQEPRRSRRAPPVQQILTPPADNGDGL